MAGTAGGGGGRRGQIGAHLQARPPLWVRERGPLRRQVWRGGLGISREPWTCACPTTFGGTVSQEGTIVKYKLF